MFTATLYYNTGYNSINTPDSLETLNAEFMTTAKDFPALDILQIMPLSSISLKITSEDDVIDADYMLLTGKGENQSVSKRAVYSVEGYTLTSPDVAVLAITLNPFLTLGGVRSVHFMDGVTIRHHVKKDEDIFGAFTEEDPYLVPSKPLEIVDGGEKFKASGNLLHLVESTIDLVELGNETKGVAYTADDGTACTVPYIPPKKPIDTNVKMTKPGVDTTPLKTVVPGANYYTPTPNPGDLVTQGIARARSLGVESAILNSWNIDKEYLTYYNYDETEDPATGLQSAIVKNLVGGVLGGVPSGLPFEYATVQNKRVLYGALNQYVLVSYASGNSAVFLPEDLTKPEDLTSDYSAPLIVMTADPRPDGKPYFRFQYYHKDEKNFFTNCVPGLVWQTAPLVYYDKSGNELDRMNFNTAQSILRQDSTIAQNRAIRGAVESGISNIIGGAVSMFGGGVRFAGGYEGSTYTSIMSGAGSIAAGAIQAGQGAYTMGAELIGNATNNATFSNAANIRRQYENARQQELQQFQISQNIVVPQINFPRSNSIRDFVGNGVFVFRYRPAASDVLKLDKILNMYGYRDTRPATDDLMTNRTKYNYLQVAGASVNATKPDASNVWPQPKWLKDACASQFAAGVRIWHTKPDRTAYTDGSNT